MSKISKDFLLRPERGSDLVYSSTGKQSDESFLNHLVAEDKSGVAESQRNTITQARSSQPRKGSDQRDANLGSQDRRQFQPNDEMFEGGLPENRNNKSNKKGKK